MLILEKSNLSVIKSLDKKDINIIHKEFKNQNIYFDFESNIKEITIEEFIEDEFFLRKFKEFHIIDLDNTIVFLKYINKELLTCEYNKNNKSISFRKQEQGLTNRYYLQSMKKVNSNFHIYVVSYKNKEKVKEKDFDIQEYINKLIENEKYLNIIKNVLKNVFNRLKQELNKYNDDLDFNDNSEYYKYAEKITNDIKNIKHLYDNIDSISNKKQVALKLSYIKYNSIDELNTLILYTYIKIIVSHLNYFKYLNVYNMLVKDATLYKEYKHIIDTCKKYKNQLDYLESSSNFDLI